MNDLVVWVVVPLERRAEFHAVLDASRSWRGCSGVPGGLYWIDRCSVEVRDALIAADFEVMAR